MSPLDNTTTQNEPIPTITMRKRGGLGDWRRTLLISGTLFGGIIAGAGGLAYAATTTGRVVWQHGHRLERIQRMVHGALDSVAATTVQEDKVHDIVATGFATMADAPAEKEAMRKQMLDLLRAPTIDRAAVEKLRAEQVARFDAKSKTMVGVVLDSADQLTPDQRVKLADRAEAMMERGPGGWRRWDGPNGGRMQPGMHRQRDEDHGPGNGPGQGSDENPG